MSPSTSTSTTKHKKEKSKKSKSSVSESTVPDSGKNEGEDLNWAFQPPPDAKAITANEDNGEFDWDAVNDDDNVELWLIRVPDNVKPKQLEGLSLDLPAGSTSNSQSGKRLTSRIGALNRKHISYDIWSMGDLDEGTNNTQAGTSHVVGGEELRSLSCLLPRKSKKGKLYLAPKPISRHLIVSARPPEPSTSEGATSLHSTIHKNPPRQKYPPELLTHRFMPYGSLVGRISPRSEGDDPGLQDVLMMEVDSGVPVATSDVDEVAATKKSKKRKEKAVEKAKDEEELNVDADPDFKMDKVEGKVEKEKKGKKRKGEDQDAGGSTKKPKKAKTSKSR